MNPTATADLEVHEIKRDGSGVLLVTLRSPKTAPLRSPGARQLACDSAAPHIGKCGVDALGNSGYLPAGSDKPLTDEEMTKNGLPIALPPGGLYLQDFKIRASL